MIRAWASRHPLPLVLVLVAAAAAPSLGGGFVSDDRFVVPGAARDPVHLWTGGLFRLDGPTGAARGQVLDMYRPLALSTVALDGILYGDRAWGFHLTSVLFHLLACALVFCLLERTNGRGAAVVGTLVLGWHPSAAEAWLWVSGRFDVLMGLLLVATLLLLERGRHKLAFLVALGACLSKEPAVVGLAFIALRPRWPTEALSGRAFRLRPPAALAALGAAAGLTLVIRYLALGGFRADPSRPSVAYLRRWAAPWLVDAFATLGFPMRLSFVEVAEGYNALPPLAVLGAAGLLVVLAAGLFLGRRRWPALLWGVGSAAGLLLPAVFVLTIGKGRYLYAPLMLMLPGVLAILDRGRRAIAERLGEARARSWVLAGAGAYLIALGAGLLNATAAFRDEATLWKTVMSERPDLSPGWGLYGLGLLSQGRHADGAPYLEKAHAIAPEDRRWIEGLAVASFHTGDARRCVSLNQRGLRLEPGSAKFLYGLALCARAAGDLEGAWRALMQGLALHPGHPGLERLRSEWDAASGSGP